MSQALTKPHLSTRIYRGYFHYLRRHHPDVDVAALCLDAGLPISHVESMDNWVSVYFDARFCDLLLARTGDPDIFYRVGLASQDPELMGGLPYFFLKNVASIGFMYRATVSIAPSVNKVYKLELLSLTKGRGVFRIVCDDTGLDSDEAKTAASQMERVVANFRGYFEAFPRIKGSKAATVDARLDESAGRPAATLDVTFQDSVTERWATRLWPTVLGALAGVALAAVADGSLAVNLMASLLGAGVGGIWTLARAFGSAQSLAQHADVTLRNLSEQHKRTYDANVEAQRNLRNVQAVEQVTRSIASAANRDELLTSVCEALVKRLDYDRAFIMIVNEDGKALRSQAQFGAEGEFAAMLAGLTLPVDIDTDDPTKLSNVFRLRQPLLIKDVARHVATLSPESQALLKASHSKAFVAVPIAANERAYGIILTDCLRLSRAVNENDREVLSTVGSQVAIALERLTAQRREIDALESAARLKDEFLANTTHELKTPLHGIIGLTESLLDGSNGAAFDDRGRRSLDLVLNSARRLTTLVDDILNLSKHQQGRLEINRRELSTQAVLDRVLATVAPLAARKNLTLQASIGAGAGAMRVDADRFEQVLVNLLGNAVKFTERGRVDVIVQVATGDSIELSVRDTGIGIPQDSLSRIFDPFFQVDGAIDRSYGGAGLGLTIARELVRLHGGDLVIESALGRGTTARATFGAARIGGNGDTTPVTLLTPMPQHVHPQQGQTPSTGPTPSETILIVDDEPINIEVLRGYLSGTGAQLVTFTNPEEAVRAVRQGLRPDLALIDINMPRLNGFGVCRELRGLLPMTDVPVIFVTAKQEEKDVVEALASGGNDFIRKPFGKGELLARVAAHRRIARYHKASSGFVPHDALRFLGYESVLDIKLGDAVDLRMAILFSDLRNFTALTAGWKSSDITRFLNSYFGHLAPFISTRRGHVDKFLGDGLMALFPTVKEAVQAAVSMSQAQRDYNAIHRTGGVRTPIANRIGIHAGPVTFGPLGYPGKVEITAIGEAVNIASRLDGLAKLFGANVLITEEVFAESGLAQSVAFRRLGPAKIRGVQKDMELVEVLQGQADEAGEAKMLTKQEFESLVRLMAEGKLSQAFDGFGDLAKRCPDDKAVQYYLAECRRRIVEAMRPVSEAA